MLRRYPYDKKKVEMHIRGDSANEPTVSVKGVVLNEEFSENGHSITIKIPLTSVATVISLREEEKW